MLLYSYKPLIQLDDFDHLNLLIVNRRVVEEVVEVLLGSVEDWREDHLLFQGRQTHFFVHDRDNFDEGTCRHIHNFNQEQQVVEA